MQHEGSWCLATRLRHLVTNMCDFTLSIQYCHEQVQHEGSLHLAPRLRCLVASMCEFTLSVWYCHEQVQHEGSRPLATRLRCLITNVWLYIVPLILPWTGATWRQSALSNTTETSGSEPRCWLRPAVQRVPEVCPLSAGASGVRLCLADQVMVQWSCWLFF